MLNSVMALCSCMEILGVTSVECEFRIRPPSSLGRLRREPRPFEITCPARLLAAACVATSSNEPASF